MSKMCICRCWLWWAIEAKAVSDRDAVLALFADPKFWTLPLVEKVIVERIMQRYAMTGETADLQTCAKLLALAPIGRSEEPLDGRPVGSVPRSPHRKTAAGPGQRARRVSIQAGPVGPRAGTAARQARGHRRGLESGRRRKGRQAHAAGLCRDPGPDSSAPRRRRAAESVGSHAVPFAETHGLGSPDELRRPEDRR